MSETIPHRDRARDHLSHDAPCIARDRVWAWPDEPEVRLDEERAPVRGERGARGLPDGVAPNEAIRQAVLACPDDDAPRQAYATWLAAQEHEFARLLAAFLSAQLRVAQALRADPCAEVGALRSWRGDGGYISAAAFRAGDALRPWFLDDVRALQQRGLVEWPQIYRGFVERVIVRARDFPLIAESLFRFAPIRHLVVVGVPEVVDELAACPHLARIRSLSLPRYSPQDAVTDDTVERLLASPYLGQLAHLRLVHQARLTPRAYQAVALAPTLPRLSGFEVLLPQCSWEHLDATSYATRMRTERMIGCDTKTPASRSRTWIGALEAAVGYQPCLHPEEHYGRDVVDLEAIVEHPIALDERIMACRGRVVSPQSLGQARWP